MPQYKVLTPQPLWPKKAGIGRAAGTDAANIVFVMDQQALHGDTRNYKAETQDR